MWNKKIGLCIFLITISTFFYKEYRSQTRFALPMDYIKDLPNEYLYDIKQDDKGFLWIACEDGLKKFDGASCVTYTNPMLSSKAGSYINFDSQNRPWYCNFDGQFFYVDKDSLIIADLPRNYGLSFTIKSDSLYYIHQDTLLLYTIHNEKLHRIAHLPESGTAHFSDDFFQLHKLADMISCFDYNGQLMERLRFDDMIFPYVMKVGKDLIYTGHKNDVIFIKKYNNGNPIILSEIKLNTLIQNVLLVNDMIYICTKNGMLTYNINTGVTEHYLSHLSITSYFNDSYSNEWVSSTSGLYLLPSSGVYNEYELPNSFFRFHHIASKIFLSDDKGTILFLDKNSLQPIYQSPSNERIYALISMSDEKDIHQLINSRRQSLIHYDFTFEGNRFFLFLPYIKSVSVLDHKYIVVASSGIAGLYKFGPDELPSSWDKIYNEYLDLMDISQITPILAGVRGKQLTYSYEIQTIFLATNTGLFSIDTVSKKEILFQGRKIYANKLLSFKDKILVLDNNGIVFIIENKEIQKINAWSEGAPIIDIVQNNEELVFWNVFNAYKCNFEKIHSNHKLAECTKLNTGILPSNFSTLTFDDNTLFIIYKNKLITAPIHSGTHQSQPLFYLDYFNVDGEKYFDNNKIHLSSEKSSVSIKYSIVDFSHSISEVSYRLNNGSWISLAPTERLLKFDALAAGSYSVEFMLNGEIQNQKLLIIVPKPWYNQWWFYLLILCLSISIVIIYFRKRIEMQIKESETLLEKTKLENGLRQSLLSSIKAQMNPHFLFNALNTIQSYIITEDKEKASRYLSMYSKLTRNILDMSDKEVVSLETEINTINLYVELERMRFPDIQYEIIVQKNINIFTSFIPSMIIQPFVENSIKHGLLHKKGERKMSIHISRQGKDLEVKIYDNGIGRDQSKLLNKNKQHQSFATKANLKRVELLNMNRNDIVWHYNDLKDNLGNSLGTEIILTIPIKYIENDQSYNRG